jgi:AcrR family transcriptional regulator
MQRPARTPRLSAARRRALILEAARSVFADYGFESASMDEVARRARITKPVIYQHFGSKRALFRELLTLAGEELIATIAAATRSVEHPRQRLWSGMRAFFRFVHERRTEYLILFSPGVYRDAEFQELVTSIELAVADEVARAITGARNDHDRLLAARALMGLANGAAAAYLDDPDDPSMIDFADSRAAHVAEAAARLAWSGLRRINLVDETSPHGPEPVERSGNL